MGKVTGQGHWSRSLVKVTTFTWLLYKWLSFGQKRQVSKQHHGIEAERLEDVVGLSVAEHAHIQRDMVAVKAHQQQRHDGKEHTRGF